MTLEKILGYFGTYTAGVDGAVSSFQFEYLTSLGFAAIVIFLGHAIVKRSALLKKFAIPAPVVSGLLFSIAVAILKASGVMAFSFDVKTIQDLCQNIFFMCVGFDSWGTKYYEQVYDALMNGKPMEVTLDQVRRQIMIIEECHRQNPFPKMK